MTSSQNGEPTAFAIPAGVRKMPTAMTCPINKATAVDNPNWLFKCISGFEPRTNTKSYEISGAPIRLRDFSCSSADDIVVVVRPVNLHVSAAPDLPGGRNDDGVGFRRVKIRRERI